MWDAVREVSMWERLIPMNSIREYSSEATGNDVSDRVISPKQLRSELKLAKLVVQLLETY